MKPTTLGALTCILTTSLVYSQQFSISDSINAFSLRLLGETINEGGDSLNVALSPYTVWTLMTILAEGAKGNTALQLESTLRIPPNKAIVRKGFQNLTNILLSKSNGVRLDLNNGIFTNKEFPIKDSFQAASKQFYNTAVTPVDFKQPGSAAGIINKYVAQATRNRITTLVTPGDVSFAQVFLTSVLFFKGSWKKPFDKDATHRETFYDEKNNKKGEVNMMFQVGTFPYYRMEEITAHVVELPYGNDGKMSMIVVLPFKGESTANVLNLMSNRPFSSIIDSLDDAAQEYVDEDIHVYLPKFKISSDFNLNIVLSKIGIKDIFDYSKANLLGMFDQYLYLSRLLQKAEIEVDEQGTTASAAAGGGLINKTTPPKFMANRPFLYFIVDKLSKSIVFNGRVSNPMTFE